MKSNLVIRLLFLLCCICWFVGEIVKKKLSGFHAWIEFQPTFPVLVFSRQNRPILKHFANFFAITGVHFTKKGFIVVADAWAFQMDSFRYLWTVLSKLSYFFCSERFENFDILQFFLQNFKVFVKLCLNRSFYGRGQLFWLPRLHLVLCSTLVFPIVDSFVATYTFFYYFFHTVPCTTKGLHTSP